ncbi:Serine/Threonine kinase domain protein (macronuclear) [Tetrahymena thermophila SB210]|uniref:Serine/Threonine kinase domain protein n=1 Tax=Tetrahymena thermophila (strain SB210) TaxID=312017 RepID=W7X0W7_TETTS|nr:Serine/Threonine kinase domain protein [Tetrahymena thermophila SB210]EWS72790.1 Serine/Threonine kinase domain protein [Tetrahymena thermophila SB210]|eukprot:XP_012654677.1 Serine/Threonine kinase domain protein [Tetrahymena thermophila SB210]
MKINEINILLKLKHPNIIDILDVQKGPDNAFYVILEHCSINLFSYYSLLKRKNRILSADKIKAIIFQIVRALVFLEKNGIIHGDINSLNVFLQDGVVKVAGFGHSVNESEKDQTRIHRQLGCFPSPEKLFGPKFKLSCKTDVFSLGCLFIELLQGKNIFREEHAPKIMQKYLIIIGRPFQQIQMEQLKALMDQENCVLPETEGIGLQNLLIGTDQEMIDLIKQMVTYVPQYRPQASEILNNPIFQEFIVKYKLQNTQQITTITENPQFYQISSIREFDRSKSNGRNTKKSKSKTKISKKRNKTLNTHKDINDSSTLPIMNNIYNPELSNQRIIKAYFDSSKKLNQVNLVHFNGKQEKKSQFSPREDSCQQGAVQFFRKGRSNSIASEGNEISKKFLNGKSQGSSPIALNENPQNYYQIEEIQYGSVQYSSNRSSSFSNDNKIKRNHNSFSNFDMQNEINQSSIALQKSILNNRLNHSKFLVPTIQQEMGFLPLIQNHTNSETNAINSEVKQSTIIQQQDPFLDQISKIEDKNLLQYSEHGQKNIDQIQIKTNNKIQIEKKRIYFQPPYLDSEKQYLKKIFQQDLSQNNKNTQARNNQKIIKK